MPPPPRPGPRSPPAPSAPRTPLTPCAHSIISEPGILGTVLTTDALYSELICDGIHSKPEIVRLWWRAKGPNAPSLLPTPCARPACPTAIINSGISCAGQRRPRNSPRRARRQRTHSRSCARKLCALHRRDHRPGPAAALYKSRRDGWTCASRRHPGPGKAANVVAIDAEGKLVGSIMGGVLAK